LKRAFAALANRAGDWPNGNLARVARLAPGVQKSGHPAGQGARGPFDLAPREAAGGAVVAARAGAAPLRYHRARHARPPVTHPKSVVFPRARSALQYRGYTVARRLP